MPWRFAGSPGKILVIRFQAMGDVMITLPYVASMKKSLPNLKIHLLTRQEVSGIPGKTGLFEKVIAIGGGRNAKIQFVLALLLLPYLWWQQYDIVLDLQHHKISRMIRFLLFPSSWSEFDRSSRISAGERTRQTIQALGIADIRIEPLRRETSTFDSVEILKRNGWDGKSPMVVLNPAGAFITRNWPAQNFISFAEQWLAATDGKTFFVIMGSTAMPIMTALFRSRLSENFIDLTNKTSPFEAFVIVGMARLMLTEDSGLMHMAWIQGVPTLALFGSSPDYWSAPLGDWSKCLSSADLPCGNCFSEVCQFGDVHCLTRYTPEFVLEQAKALLMKLEIPVKI